MGALKQAGDALKFSLKHGVRQGITQYTARKVARAIDAGGRKVMGYISGRSITTQRDSGTVYRARRRVGGRRHRKFLNKMRRALISEAPMQVYTALFKSSDTAAAGTQQIGGVYMGDTNTTAQGDLWNVFKDAFTATTVADVEAKKLYIKSMHMDFQFKNTGTEQLFVDMYQIIARKSYDNGNLFNTQVDDWYSDMADVGATTFTNPALDLFSLPNFCRYYKILRKTTHLIKPDEVISLTIGSARPRVLSGRLLTDYGGTLKGITRVIAFRIRGVPENTASTSGLTGWSAAWSAQTVIHYAFVPGNASETIGQTK